MGCKQRLVAKLIWNPQVAFVRIIFGRTCSDFNIQGHKKVASWTAFAVTETLPLKPVMILREGTEGATADVFSGSAALDSVPVHYLGQMPGKGVSDGFKIDSDGLIWSSMPAGLCILDPKPPRPHVVAKALSDGLSSCQHAFSSSLPAR